jgi:hypothetical protein
MRKESVGRGFSIYPSQAARRSRSSPPFNWLEAPTSSIARPIYGDRRKEMHEGYRDT